MSLVEMRILLSCLKQDAICASSAIDRAEIEEKIKILEGEIKEK